MIVRIWRGWTTPANAEVYRRLVLGEVIPAIEQRKIDGFLHIDVLRGVAVKGSPHVEFTTIMHFRDLAAIQAFAGDDWTLSHVPPAARAVLARFDERARHYEVLERRPQRKAAREREPSQVTLPKDACLLVIDVQRGFGDARWGRRNNPAAEANVARLLAAWRQAAMPVVHIHHDSAEATGAFLPGTAGNKPKREAEPLAGETVIHKTVNGAFIGTALEAELRGRNIGTLVIAGLTTNHCVSTTARMAGNLGFATFVVEDATAAFAAPGLDGRMRAPEQVHTSALSDLAGEFATIADTAGFIAATEARPEAPPVDSAGVAMP